MRAVTWHNMLKQVGIISIQGVVLEQEMAKLMEDDLDDVDLRVTTKNQMRQMIGLSMHVATAGFALTGLKLPYYSRWGVNCRTTEVGCNDVE